MGMLRHLRLTPSAQVQKRSSIFTLQTSTQQPLGEIPLQTSAFHVAVSSDPFPKLASLNRNLSRHEIETRVVTQIVEH